MFSFFAKVASLWVSFKTKMKTVDWKTVRKLLVIILIVALLVFIYVRERQHKTEIANLQSQITTSTTSTTTNKPKVSVTTDTQTDENGNPTASAISSAGDLGANMATDFYKQVAKNKGSSLYSYNFAGTPTDAITNIQDGISSGTAQKEVKDADFVTITQGATTTKTTELTAEQVAAEAATGKDSLATTETSNTTTVKVNAYYNYKPSVYYMPQAYPDTFKRHDIVYVNRDFMVDVNYDADRTGNKVGGSIGYRIKSW